MSEARSELRSGHSKGKTVPAFEDVLDLAATVAHDSTDFKVETAGCCKLFRKTASLITPAGAALYALNKNRCHSFCSPPPDADKSYANAVLAPYTEIKWCTVERDETREMKHHCRRAGDS